MAYVADTAGERKGEMLSWFSSITIVGNLLGAPVGGLMLEGAEGPALGDFHRAYLASGVSGAMALVLAIALLRGGEARERGGSQRGSFRGLISGIREVLSDGRVVLTSGMEGLQNMTVGALEAFLPVYAVTVAGLSPFQAGVLWGVQVLVTILSKPAMGWVSDRYGRKPLITAGMISCALSFGAIPLLRDFHLLMGAALFFGLGEAFVTSSSAALVADLCKERRFGTAMGAFGTIFDVGHASGPMLAGVLIAGLGYLPSFWIMSSMLLVSVPVFIARVREGKKPKGSPKTP
jgi:MFS family permease